jgi:hypothetical protein
MLTIRHLNPLAMDRLEATQSRCAACYGMKRGPEIPVGKCSGSLRGPPHHGHVTRCHRHHRDVKPFELVPHAPLFSLVSCTFASSCVSCATLDNRAPFIAPPALMIRSPACHRHLNRITIRASKLSAFKLLMVSTLVLVPGLDCPIPCATYIELREPRASISMANLLHLSLFVRDSLIFSTLQR